MHSQPATTYRYPCPRHWSPSRLGVCVFTSKLSMWAATVYDITRGVWIGALGEQVLKRRRPIYREIPLPGKEAPFTQTLEELQPQTHQCCRASTPGNQCGSFKD